MTLRLAEPTLPRPAQSRRLVRTGLVTAALGITVGTALLVLYLAGELDPPALPGLAVNIGPTVWLLPVVNVIADAAAVATVGCLLAAAFLAPGLRPAQIGLAQSRRRLLLSPVGFHWVRAASLTAAVWAIASGLALILAASDLLGIPPAAALRIPILFDTARSVTQGQTLAVTFAITVTLAVACRVVRTVNGAALAFMGAVAAVTPIAFAGHAAGAGNHQLAVSALLLHVVPVTLWLGGLLVLTLGSLRAGAGLVVAARRYSALAAACLLLVAASGVVSAWTRLRGWSDLFGTAYGRIVLVKITVLLVAGGLGWLHRTRSLPALAAGRPWMFGRFAAVELGVLAVGLGAGVGLAATRAPRVASAGDAANGLLGYPMPGPFTVTELFTRWLVDPLIVCVALLAVAGYGLAVLRLRRRDEHWSWWRLSSWTAGWSLIVFVTCGGAATYAPVLLSVHMAQHMTLAIVAPILLTLSGPITLALHAIGPSFDPALRGPREWICEWVGHPLTRMMAHPLMALGMYAAGLYAMYFTGLYELALRSHAAHLAMIVHLVGAGYFFYWLLIGADPLPKPIRFLTRVLLLSSAVVFHIGLGFVLTRSEHVLASDWFATLSRSWGASPLADQHLGGQIAWLFAGVGLAAVLCVMIVQRRGGMLLSRLLLVSP